MADRFYGINRGETAATISGSTTNKDIELVIDDAVGLLKADILTQLKYLEKAVREDTGFNNE